jgi:hypothetical protein
METFKIARPTTTWISTEVKAETLEEALKIADQLFYEGEGKVDEETFSIDNSQYWASDEYNNLYIQETQDA